MFAEERSGNTSTLADPPTGEPGVGGHRRNLAQRLELPAVVIETAGHGKIRGGADPHTAQAVKMI